MFLEKSTLEHISVDEKVMRKRQLATQSKKGDVCQMIHTVAWAGAHEGGLFSCHDQSLCNAGT